MNGCLAMLLLGLLGLLIAGPLGLIVGILVGGFASMGGGK